MNKVFFALNKHNHTAEVLTGFNHWEEVQSAFQFGIRMSDGSNATGIGRASSHKQFINRADFGEWSVIGQQSFVNS